MGLIKLNCSNCGAELQFDENQKIGYCSHCGTKHVLEDVKNTTINNVTNNVSNEYKIGNAAIINNNQSGPTEHTYILRAKKFIEKDCYTDAEEYLNKALDINPENEEAQTMLDNLYSFWGRAVPKDVINKITSEFKFANGHMAAAVRLIRFLDLTSQQKKLYIKDINGVIEQWQAYGIDAAIKYSKLIDIDQVPSEEDNDSNSSNSEQKSVKNKNKSKVNKKGIIIAVIAFAMIVLCANLVIYIVTKTGGNPPPDKFNSSTDLSINEDYIIDGVTYNCGGVNISNDLNYYEVPGDNSTLKTILPHNTFLSFNYTFTNSTSDDILIYKTYINLYNNLSSNYDNPAYFLEWYPETNTNNTIIYSRCNIVEANHIVVPAKQTIVCEICFDVENLDYSSSNYFITWWSSVDNKPIWFIV